MFVSVGSVRSRALAFLLLAASTACGGTGDPDPGHDAAIDGNDLVDASPNGTDAGPGPGAGDANVAADASTAADASVAADASTHDAGIGACGNVESVDMLFMVDDSGSMREEQRKLRREFPRIIRALVTGDVDGDSVVDGPAVLSLRVGVVTSDMGVGGLGTGVGEFAIQSCGASPAAPGGVDFERAHYGDDGVLRRQGSSVAATAAEPIALDCDVDATLGDDVIGYAELPAYLTFDAASAADEPALDEYVRRASCLANAGTAGCAFEQQLESVLKAMTPPSETPLGGAFHTAGDVSRSTGHGCIAYLADGTCDASQQGADVVNSGWFRDDSLLAVVMITDEDDCSASDSRVFDFSLATGPYADPYTVFQSQTRCQRYEADLLHPVARYVDGLLARRALDPQRLVFALITGVPPTLTDEVGEGITNLDAILDAPAMQYVYLTQTRNAGPGNTPVDVPYSAIAEACHHYVPQSSVLGSASTTLGSTTIEAVTLASGVVPLVGMGLSGATIAAGSVVTNVVGSGPYTLTVDAPAIGTLAGATVTALGFTATGTADTTLGSNTLTNFTLDGGGVPIPGMTLTAPGLPARASVLAVAGSGPYTITMGAVASVSASNVALGVQLLDVSAVPARRLIEVARGLETASQNQANTLVQSICVDDFRPAFERILRLVQSNLAGGCEPG